MPAEILSFFWSATLNGLLSQEVRNERVNVSYRSVSHNGYGLAAFLPGFCNFTGITIAYKNVNEETYTESEPLYVSPP
jgi:hypothetical protein